MTFQERLQAFIKLGNQLRDLPEATLDEWYFRATGFNNWFTRENVFHAVRAIGEMLEEKKLEKWTSVYDLDNSPGKRVAIIMAGNIPLVGFHDFLSVLMAGHQAIAKLSSQDPYLLKQVTALLIEIEPAFQDKIVLTQGTLTNFDAVIATGSNNSARYFDQYFSRYPHIIRKNRTSVAIITGKENKEEIEALGKDIFQYYGLGCRNVSKLFVPQGYDFQFFIKSMESFEHIADHHKWVNNYDYNKSIYLVNREPHFDSGFFLLKESEAWVSPISVLYYEFYSTEEELTNKLEAHKELIQCTVSQTGQAVSPGNAQAPELWDYADGVDTMKFLTQKI
ncbi:acyl-CoA reductase [Marivirga sp. S37H4]|uniref:Acyl-CoA reductase n=1 Tax=Marivirga aurantiaca TaxID=2802615 RepID=A0A935C622_9BACT|nr:acyl-CoA reductase [Marivirga aurantiaca]MBK6264129.1 acyl-CoA reductase [Marivirga aurantiaca]